MTEVPYWAIFTKLMVRTSSNGRRLRVYLEIPTGSRQRAEHIQRCLRLGRVEEGTLHVEGGDLTRAMRLLGFPDSVLSAAERLSVIRGTPGILTPDSVLEARKQAAEELKSAVAAEYRAEIQKSKSL